MSDVTDLIQTIDLLKKDVGIANAARDEALTDLKSARDKHSATIVDIETKLVRITEELATKATALTATEQALNELSKKVNRPGFGGTDDEEKTITLQARGLLEIRHQTKVTKKSADFQFNPTEAEIEDAKSAVTALKNLLNCTSIDLLCERDRKALSAFNMGSNGFILSPQMSQQILSCLVDVSDITGLFQSMTISGPSIKFLVDNVRLDSAAWACETTCFANNPQADLTNGLGEREIKPETLRFVLCATRDVLEDASMDIQGWALGKVNWAFRNSISSAALTGTGEGQPLGVLDPRSGVPICETTTASPEGGVGWQDLIALKWGVPVQYHAGGRYIMNERTFGYMLTQADGTGRPIMIASPQADGTFIINGSPITVATQMPDLAPGALPVAFGNWNQAYMIIYRKAVTMQQDPYSAGFCVLFKFESRVGGGVICPNAAKLLRVA